MVLRDAVCVNEGRGRGGRQRARHLLRLIDPVIGASEHEIQTHILRREWLQGGQYVLQVSNALIRIHEADLSMQA